MPPAASKSCELRAFLDALDGLDALDVVTDVVTVGGHESRKVLPALAPLCRRLTCRLAPRAKMMAVRCTSVWMHRRLRATTLAILAVALIAAVVTPAARADGDPGSDVLVYQDLFAGSDAGLSVQQQVELGGLLKGAARAGFPVRVAIIASSFDLGAVTELWHHPREYARFLGIELSLAYKQRLLVVMPNGFGFNWTGHSADPAYRVLGGILIGPGGAGLFNATEAAVGKLALADGGKLPSAAGSTGASAAPAGAGGSATARPGQRSGIDECSGSSPWLWWRSPASRSP